MEGIRSPCFCSSEDLFCVVLLSGACCFAQNTQKGVFIEINIFKLTKVYIIIEIHDLRNSTETYKTYDIYGNRK